MKILVTGIAGFIGYHLAKRLLSEGGDWQLTGIDNVNDYYDVQLKKNRLKDLGLDITNSNTATNKNCAFIKMDLADKAALLHLFETEHFDYVISLAAQAGVRYSLTNPEAYIQSNMSGFLNILEACRKYPVKHLIYASSSSVYGINTIQPFSEKGAADHPASLYAVTKRSNELMAHSYAHLYQIPSTGLRFFTVYGPWGRPDMALFLFTKAILENKPIDVFNNGDMLRDFTYVDDIIEGIVRLIPHIPNGVTDWDGAESSVSPAPAVVYNIGRGAPVRLMDFVAAIETELGKKAAVNYLPMQKGDVPATWADCSALQDAVAYSPSTGVKEGIRRFIEWYRGYYGK